MPWQTNGENGNADICVVGSHRQVPAHTVEDCAIDQGLKRGSMLPLPVIIMRMSGLQNSNGRLEPLVTKGTVEAFCADRHILLKKSS